MQRRRHCPAPGTRCRQCCTWWPYSVYHEQIPCSCQRRLLKDTMPKYLKRTNALLLRYSLRRLGTWSAPCSMFFLGCRPKRGKVFLWTCLKGSWKLLACKHLVRQLMFNSVGNWQSKGYPGCQKESGMWDGQVLAAGTWKHRGHTSARRLGQKAQALCKVEAHGSKSCGVLVPRACPWRRQHREVSPSGRSGTAVRGGVPEGERSRLWGLPLCIPLFELTGSTRWCSHCKRGSHANSQLWACGAGRDHRITNHDRPGCGMGACLLLVIPPSWW